MSIEGEEQPVKRKRGRPRKDTGDSNSSTSSRGRTKQPSAGTPSEGKDISLAWRQFYDAVRKAITE